MTTKIVLLAAGQGKRMKNSNLPKVLFRLRGQPMINFVLRAIGQSTATAKPVIVVGYKAEQVKQALGPEYTYVLQAEQLGTGHAVACARDVLIDQADNILVLFGDKPFISPASISKIIALHEKSQPVMTIATIKVPDFNDWRKCYYGHGRILRNDDSHICGIIEKKDASPDQLAILELNPSILCFRADWLWTNLSRLSQTNAQNEFYLTELLSMANAQNEAIQSVAIDPHEGLGINNATELALLETIDYKLST